MGITELVEPLKAVNNANGLPIMVIALLANGQAIVVDDGGQMAQLPIADITVDWRYDHKEHVWVDAEIAE